MKSLKLIGSLLASNPHGCLSFFIFLESLLIFLIWAVDGMDHITNFTISSLVVRIIVPIFFMGISSGIRSKITNQPKKQWCMELTGFLAFILALVIPGEISTKRTCQEDGDCSDFKFLELDFLLHSLCFTLLIQKYLQSAVVKLGTSSICLGYGFFRFVDYSEICSKELGQLLASRLVIIMVFFAIQLDILRAKKKKKRPIRTNYFKELFHYSDDFVFVVDRKSLGIMEVNKRTVDYFREASFTKGLFKYFVLPQMEPIKQVEDSEKIILKIPSEIIPKHKTDTSKPVNPGQRNLATLLKEMRGSEAQEGNPAKPSMSRTGDSESSDQGEKIIESNLLFANEENAKNKNLTLRIKTSEDGKCFLITAREEMEKQIWENASKVMNQVCHDIRNPASSIELLCKKAKTELDLPEKFKKNYFSTIKTSAMVIQVLAEDLMDVFLMKQGKFKLRNQLLCLKKVIGLAKKITEVQLGEKNVKVLVEIGPEVPENIRTDKDRFFQIMLNLMSNARKFTEVGSIKIQVQKSSEKNHVYRVSVSDTGTGMSPEFLKVIGNEGVREENAASSALNPKGIGLGLNLCKKLALLIGPGTEGLVVKSEIGKGSEFSFFVKDLTRVFKQTTQQTKIKNKAKNHRAVKLANSNISNFLSKDCFSSPKRDLIDKRANTHIANRLVQTNQSIMISDSNQASSFDLGDDLKEESNGEVADEIVYCLENVRSHNSATSAGVLLTNQMNLVFKESRRPYEFSHNHHGCEVVNSPPRKQKIMRMQTLKKKEEIKKQLSTRNSLFVLLADDDNFNLIFLEEQLKKLKIEGLSIKKARNGQIAWEEFKKFSESNQNKETAAIFLDNQMPLLKGVDVARKITKHCEKKNILSPFLILVSGDKSDQESMKFFDFSLSKPINKTDLRSLMVDMEILS